MLLQEATTGAHPLSGSIAELVWLIPVLPFIGFLINGWLSLSSAARIGPKDPTAAGHGGAAHGADHGHGEDSGGAGQFRGGEQLIDVAQAVRPGTILTILEPLYEGDESESADTAGQPDPERGSAADGGLGDDRAAVTPNDAVDHREP